MPRMPNSSYRVSLTVGWCGAKKVPGACDSRDPSPLTAVASLHREPQIGQRGTDLVERRDDRIRGGQQKEFVRVARAILQQRRRRIAAGVDLHGIDRDAGGLDVVAGLLLPRIDRALAGVPAILGIKAVGQ